MNSQRKFRYKAIDAGGVIRIGLIIADNGGSATRALISEGFVPLLVELQDGASQFKYRKRSINASDKFSLLLEMATLIGSGVPLRSSFESLLESYKDGLMAAKLAEVDTHLRSGLGLFGAISKSNLGFPGYVMALIESGEANGQLGHALRQASLQMEQDLRVRREIASALVYPFILIASGIIAISVVFLGVLPGFKGIVAGSRADVPTFSIFLIDSATYVREHIWVFLLLTLISVVALGSLLAKRGVRTWIYDWASENRFLGPWLVSLYFGRWAAMMASLLSSQIRLSEALLHASRSVEIRRLKADIDRLPRDVEGGSLLSDSLNKISWIPRSRINMIRAGELSGNLPQMLEIAGRIEADSAKRTQDAIVKVIEPSAIVLIGLVIGTLMISVMMAITSLNSVS